MPVSREVRRNQLRFADMHVPYIVMHVEGMVRATLVRVNGAGSLRDRAPEECTCLCLVWFVCRCVCDLPAERAVAKPHLFATRGTDNGCIYTCMCAYNVWILSCLYPDTCTHTTTPTRPLFPPPAFPRTPPPAFPRTPPPSPPLAYSQQ
jgi:hypothetical protein